MALIGCATAVCGAWLALRAPASSSPAAILIITLGGQVATGALAHAGQRGAVPPRVPTGEHTPTGFAGRE